MMVQIPPEFALIQCKQIHSKNSIGLLKIEIRKDFNRHSSFLIPHF